MTGPTPEELTRTKLNLETARIAWKDLQRFFASGAAVYVSDALDLIEVAYRFSEDDKQQVERWLLQGQVARVSDEQAQAWHDADAEMWAVVVSPYVLVQQLKK